MTIITAALTVTVTLFHCSTSVLELSLTSLVLSEGLSSVPLVFENVLQMKKAQNCRHGALGWLQCTHLPKIEALKGNVTGGNFRETCRSTRYQYEKKICLGH